jgi:hypothetical protein
MTENEARKTSAVKWTALTETRVPAKAAKSEGKARKPKRQSPTKSQTQLPLPCFPLVSREEIELKKVQWPTRKQTINNTLVVNLCVIVVGKFIWASTGCINRERRTALPLQG